MSVVKHSALDAVEWSAVSLQCSIPLEGAPAYQGIGGRVGLRVGIP